MESTVNEIIGILREQYHFEIPPALEIRIKDLFDIGRISETGDYDKIIYSIYKRHSEMFSNKHFLEKAMRVIFERNLKRINILMIGSDLGESSYSNIITFERELKQKSDTEVSYF
ncbi:TPA: hypothetical protein DCW38_00435, partial [candidate division WOR-3 bacterium]|nr:hypothetical protein [candidate division WOR-3 bacterium]